MEITLIIVALVFWFIIRPFFRDWKASDKKIMNEGGIRRKYATLIDIILDSEARMKIHREDVSSAILGFNYTGGYTKFQLIHGFEGISVTYTSENNIYGEHQLKWEFNESENQEDMGRKIFIDIQTLDSRLTGEDIDSDHSKSHESENPPFEEYFNRYFFLKDTLNDPRTGLNLEKEQKLKNEFDELRTSLYGIFMEVRVSSNLDPEMTFEQWIKNELNQINDIKKLLDETDDLLGNE